MERIRGMVTIVALLVGVLMIGLCLSTTASAADHYVVDVEASENGVHMEHVVLVDESGVIRSQAPFIRTITFTYNPRIVATIAISNGAAVSKRTGVIRSQAPMTLAYGTKFVQYKQRSTSRTASPTNTQREHVATLARWADDMRDSFGPSTE